MGSEAQSSRANQQPGMLPMPHDLIDIITGSDPAVRNRALDAFCRGVDAAAMLDAAGRLDGFRRNSDNLYERVRAAFFLSAIYRYHLPQKLPGGLPARIPYGGYLHLLKRRFAEAVDDFLAVQKREGPSDAVASALAAGYHALGFQSLADQVRRSVRSVRGNQWMFRVGHPADHPLRLHPQLLKRTASNEPFPILAERTPVRMDLSHSGWSDIFFLGMDFPEGARVLNVSVDLAVRGRHPQPQPPIEVYLRVIDRPILRLVSVDLKSKTDITSFAEVFDFARDYLGLLKAAVIAAGIVPPGLEGAGQSLADLLANMVGPGLGLEIVSKVNDIPKGSRLAVSTNLLASIITACMRATGQIQSLTGALQESERKLVAARAILGEWLGGSGGGWQDSGGIWPGIKIIEGCAAADGDPEYGISRGRLLPNHHIYGADEVRPETRGRFAIVSCSSMAGWRRTWGRSWRWSPKSICFVRRSNGRPAGGNRHPAIDRRGVSAFRSPRHRPPYDAEFLRSDPEDHSRSVELLHGNADRAGAEAIRRFVLGLPHARRDFGRRHGVHLRALPQSRSPRLLAGVDAARRSGSCKRAAVRDGAGGVRLRHQRPRHGGRVLADGDAFMPPGYYAICAPEWLRQEDRQLSHGPQTRSPDSPQHAARHPRLAGSTELLLDALFPQPTSKSSSARPTHRSSLDENGFDSELHEEIRGQPPTGRIGLAQNRLAASAVIKDVMPDDVIDWATARSDAGQCRRRGVAAGRRRSGRALAGRRDGQPLDPGGGRGQSPASLRAVPRQVSQFHRGPPGQEPPRGRPVPCRRAAPRCHQLLDARADRPVAALRTTTTGIPGRCCSRRDARWDFA